MVLRVLTKWMISMLVFVTRKEYSDQITAQKLEFSIKELFSKFEQICSFLKTWSQLLNHFLIFFTFETNEQVPTIQEVVLVIVPLSL